MVVCVVFEFCGCKEVCELVVYEFLKELYCCKSV